jgi:multisubunit Na+/H+ antiporter MnhB subunit
MRTIIFLTILRFLVPLLAGITIWMFFRGHDYPGGGFIAGLILAVARLLQNLGKSTRGTWLKLDAKLMIGLGLILVAVSGLPGLIGDHAFLATSWTDGHILIISKVGTPTLFDLGVFAVTYGMVTQITSLLIEEK